MKIVNILLSAKNGGVEQSFVSYCRLLKSLNHQVLAIVKKNAAYIDDLKNLEIEIAEIENNFGYCDLIAAWKIKKLIQNFEANLIFAHVGRGISLARKSLKICQKSFSKIPLIAVNHSNNVKRSIGANVVLSVNKEIFYKTVDKGQRADRSFVMPNFIEVKSTDQNFNIEDFAWDKNKEIIIGAIGRLSKEKGFEHLLKALEILKSKKYNVKLKIAGSGEEKENLIKMTNALALQDDVEFLGWIDDKEKFFSKIDIFCSSSSEETFGIVLLEAMNYMKPIIATNTDGAKSIIRNNINGILIEKNPAKINDKANQKSDDESVAGIPNGAVAGVCTVSAAGVSGEIAKAVQKLISSNPDFIFDLVTNAKKDLDKNYSSKAVGERIQEVIKIANYPNQ